MVKSLRENYKQFVQYVSHSEWNNMYGDYLSWCRRAEKKGYDVNDYAAYFKHEPAVQEYDYRKWRETAPSEEDYKRWKRWIKWKDGEHDGKVKYQKTIHPSGCIYCGTKGCSCDGIEREGDNTIRWQEFKERFLPKVYWDVR